MNKPRKAGVGAVATVMLLLVSGCDRGVVPQPSPISSTVSSAAAVPSGPIAGLADAGVPGTFSILDPRHALGVADANGDGVDDIVAIASIKTAEDSERRLVAFDGKTRGILWKSAPLRPWAGMPSRARIMVLVGGGNVALSAGWTQIDFYELKTGARKGAARLDGIPGVRSCPDPKNPARFYLELTEGGFLAHHPVGGAFLDVAGMKTAAAPRPDFCPTDWVADEHELSDCHFRHGNELARAACAPTTAAPTIPAFQLAYVVTTPEAAIAIGNAPGEPHSPGNVMVARFESEKKAVLWTRTIAEAQHTEPEAKEERAIHQIDVTPAGVLLVIDVMRGSTSLGQRIIMLDTSTGAVRFEHVLSDAVVQDPRVVGARLYLPRTAPYESASWYAANGGVDVLDANTGAPLFSLGGGEKF